MPQHTSLIPPNVIPPDPLIVKVIATVFSVSMSLILLAGIGFVCIEFFADMTGQPLNEEARQSPPEPLELPEEKTTREFKSPFELITPRHQTRMRGPEVAVIYTVRVPNPPATPPELFVDGTQKLWEVQYGANTWFARLLLEPGEHRMQTANEVAEFVIDPLGSARWSPDQWGWYSPHPGTNETDRCGDCHEMHGDPTSLLQGGKTKTIGQWRGMASCFACHFVEEHGEIHRIYQPTTDRCLRCHSMH